MLIVSFYISWMLFVDLHHVYNKTNNCWSFMQQFKLFSPRDRRRPKKSYVALGSASCNITFLWPSSTLGETIWNVALKTSSYLYNISINEGLDGVYWLSIFDHFPYWLSINGRFLYWLSIFTMLNFTDFTQIS